MRKLTAKADRLFSLWVRSRDGKCVRCGSKKRLQNSHFWSRRRYTTRYSAENCDTLCAGCHKYHWEGEKQGDYRDYLINRITAYEYDKLRKLAEEPVTNQQKYAIVYAAIEFVKTTDPLKFRRHIVWNNQIDKRRKLEAKGGTL